MYDRLVEVLIMLEPGVALGPKHDTSEVVVTVARACRWKTQNTRKRDRYALPTTAASPGFIHAFYTQWVARISALNNRVHAPCRRSRPTSLHRDARYVQQYTPWRWHLNWTGLRCEPSTPPATRYPLAWLMQMMDKMFTWWCNNLANK
jgi:hypothetical protein